MFDDIRASNMERLSLPFTIGKVLSYARLIIEIFGHHLEKNLRFIID